MHHERNEAKTGKPSDNGGGASLPHFLLGVFLGVLASVVH